jgi:hypothetical protein
VPVWIPSYNGKKLKNIDRGRCAVEKIRTCDVDKVRPIILLFMLKVKKNQLILEKSRFIFYELFVSKLVQEVQMLNFEKYTNQRFGDFFRVFFFSQLVLMF